MERIYKMQDVLIEVDTMLKEFEYEEVLSIIAMLMEENCRRNGYDMIECVEGLLQVAKDVRELHGVY